MNFLQILAELRTPVMDAVMHTVSLLGTPFVAVGVICWFYLNVEKKTGVIMGYAFTFSCLAAQGLKILFRVPRPWVLNNSLSAAEGAEVTATGYSFPSVHSQSVGAIGTSLILYNKKRNYRLFITLMMLLVIFSRMYLGVHTPLDVCIGLLIGVTGALAMFSLGPGLLNRKQREEVMMEFFMVVLSLVLLFIASSLSFNGTIPHKDASDSFQTAGLSIGLSISFVLERRLIRFSVEGSRREKLLRFALAAGGAALIILGLRPLTSGHLFLIALRYLLTGLWIAAAVPVLSLKLGLCRREDDARPGKAAPAK